MPGFDLNKLCQYTADADLLSAALAEQERLLWELEYLAREPECGGRPDITNRLNLVKAQILLINHYTAISAPPHLNAGKAASP